MRLIYGSELLVHVAEVLDRDGWESNFVTEDLPRLFVLVHVVDTILRLRL